MACPKGAEAGRCATAGAAAPPGRGCLMGGGTRRARRFRGGQQAVKLWPPRELRALVPSATPCPSVVFSRPCALRDFFGIMGWLPEPARVRRLALALTQGIPGAEALRGAVSCSRVHPDHRMGTGHHQPTGLPAAPADSTARVDGHALSWRDAHAVRALAGRHAP